MRGRCAVLSLPLSAALVAGHGAMSVPPARNAGRDATTANDDGCQSGACQFFSQGCNIGCRCTEATGGNSFIDKLCGANATARPTVNDKKYRTFNRNPAPAQAGCVGHSQNASYQANGECFAYAPSVGPWIVATCDGDAAHWCVYDLPGCTGTPQCTDMQADGMCHKVSAVDSYSYYAKGICSQNTFNIEQWDAFIGVGDWT
eukprot:gene7868-1458_t